MRKKLKLISLLLLLTILFTGCTQNLENLNPIPMPDYPQTEGDSGYKISGVATDKNGNSLEGVQIKIADKLYAITDENGYYQVSGLEGEQKVKAVFHDYEFETKEFTVNQATKQDIKGTNAKKYMVTFDSYAGFDQNVEVFGVQYQINGKWYSGDDNQKAFIENLEGKTTITPYKEGFTFTPEKMDVYSTTNAKFTANPSDGKYSISGNIDISGFESDEHISAVDIYVNGKLATQSYMQYSYSNMGEEVREMKYRIDGLDKEAGNYEITYKINDVQSIQKLTVSGPTTEANFKYYLTKEVDIKLDITGVDSDLLELPNGYFLDYDIRVYDEDGTFVKKYSGRDPLREGVVIWRGAKLEITGLFKTPDEIGTDGTVISSEMRQFDETEKISESDMRKDYFEGEYFKVRASLRRYDPDDDDD